MFYTDMTFLEFNEKFSTEEACLEAIFQCRWPRGFVCAHCGHNDGYRLQTRRSIECCVCGRQKSITSGTIFHRSKTPLRIWFHIIYELAHDKGGASTLKLAKRFGIHEDTIWHIVSKIRIAMGCRDENLQLAGFIELDEAFGSQSPERPVPAMRRSCNLSCEALLQSDLPSFLQDTHSTISR